MAKKLVENLEKRTMKTGLQEEGFYDGAPHINITKALDDPAEGDDGSEDDHDPNQDTTDIDE